MEYTIGTYILCMILTVRSVKLSECLTVISFNRSRSLVTKKPFNPKYILYYIRMMNIK